MGANSKSGGGGGKIGRNKRKCEEYRLYIGKPRGPGRKGTKSGKNWLPKNAD